MRRAWAILLLCGCQAAPAPRGLLRVVVTGATAPAQITRVSVSVQPAAVEADLAQDPGGTWSGALSVPGGGETVAARAWAGTAVVASGSGSVTVIAGQTVPLAIALLDATGSPPAPPHSPVVSLTAAATSVAVGGTVALTATAFDADGSAIAYAWTAAPDGCGTFSPPGSASTSFTALAVGRCTVTVTASAGGLSGSDSTPIDVGPATPVVVQHLSSTSNPPFQQILGNGYRFTLPNPVQAGNCLVLGISYSFSATRTVSISDSSGNVWPAAPAATTTDSTVLVSSIFVQPGAAGGTTTLTVSFDQPVATFQYTVSEIANVDPVSPVAGASAGQTAAPDLAVPAFAPAENDANGGNLIWSYFIDHATPVWNGVVRFAAGTGFTLLDADIGWSPFGYGLPHASQLLLQPTAAAVAPAMTATMPPNVANDAFNGVAVALRVAPSGAPAPPGMHIQRISLFTNPTPPTEWVFQLPTQGNLIVGVVCQADIIDIDSITDSRGNTYVKVEPQRDEPQIWYAAAATPDPDLVITVHSTGTPVNASFIWYDIAGAAAAPLDAVADLSGAGVPVGSDTLLDAPVITPPSPGLTLAAVSFGTGPALGLAPGSPAGAVFDYVYYDGELDIDQMDNADGRAHLYDAGLSPEHFGWVLNHTAGTTASATAVHFAAAAP